MKISNFKLPDFAGIAKLASFVPFLNRQPATLKLNLLPEVVHPVVVVPGFLGTWPSAFTVKGGKLDPVTGVYTNIVEGLTGIGFVPGVSLFPFPYDWRLGLEELGPRLGQEIARIRQLSPEKAAQLSPVKVDYSKVDILAHSMGGLIARAYVQSNSYANDVRRLALVATPNFGAVAAYYGYEGGETTYIGVPTASAKSMIGLLDARESGNPLRRLTLTYQAIRGTLNYDMQQYLSKQTASVRDLLPLGRSKYLYSRTETGVEKVYPFGPEPGYPVNLTLEKMDTPEQLALLDRVEEIHCFYSNSHGTRRRVQVEDRYSQTKPLYEHGYPLNPQPAESFSPGDTIVVEESARLDLPPYKPDASIWKTQIVNEEISSVLGTPLDHVQIIGDPAPVRYILNYIAQRPFASPITPDMWDGPTLAQRKPNYLALLT